MEKRGMPHGKFMLPLMGALAFLLALATLAQSASYRNQNQTQIKPLGFEGTFQTQGDSVLVPLGEGALVSTWSCEEVTLRGRFDRPLTEGEQLLFLIEYLEVHIYLDGEELYSYAVPGTYPVTARSGGMTWNHTVVPRAVGTEEEWTILLRSKYSNNYYSAYRDFMDSLCTGDSGALARAVVGENWPYIVFGAATILVSLILLGLCLALAVQKVPVHRSIYYFICFALANGIAVLLNPRYSTLVLDNPILVMQLEPLALIAAEALLLAYLGTFLKTAAQRVNRILLLTTMTGIVLLSVVQLAGWADAYAIRTTLTIFMGVVLLAGAVTIWYELRRRRTEEFRFLVVPGLILLGCSSLEALNYGVELLLPGKLLFWGALTFIVAQLGVSVHYIRAAILLARQAMELERRMVENNVAIMLSQIQPHFLYNTLSVIKGLCQTEPQRAELAVDHFSDFLRGNLDSLTASTPIAFQRELAHTRHYLELEQMRFGKRLRVVYDTPVTLFRIPSLTIQPLAENAVRYGVTKRREGGTVTITTGETETAYTVTVTDDGLGFDPQAATADGRTHIGIRNVGERMQAQCGGRLTLRSTPGAGTVAVLSIPKERREP